MISDRALNRTLLQRQHLLDRVSMPATTMVEHLLGLQAQEVLPPYLSLFARLRDFKAVELSATLEARETVRVLVMRGTIHLVVAHDVGVLRPFVQPLLTKVIKSTDWGRGFPVEQYDVVARRTREALADGPLTVKRLGEELASGFPDRSPSDCGNLARHLVPLVQLPPRGLWKQPGGQVYATVEQWLGSGAQESDAGDIVRRYLRAFGPATPADVSAWSGATGLRDVFKQLGDELVVLEGEDGKKLWDLDGLAHASGDEPAPVRLLGRYDNVWLSHARRDRVTAPDKRPLWMGVNGGVGSTVFVDGMLEGMWWQADSGAIDVTLYRELTREEKIGLDDEVAAVEAFLRS